MAILYCYWVSFFSPPFFMLANPNEKGIPSTIKEVTVFRQGAEVLRDGKVSIPAGRSELKFSGAIT